MPITAYGWFVMAVITLAYASSPAATFTETWGDGSGFSRWTFEVQCAPYPFAIVPDPTNARNRVVRVENRLTRCGSAGGRPVARNELKIANNDYSVLYGQDFWWKQRVYIPLDWPRGPMPVSWLTVMQVIGGRSGVGWKPDFKLVITRDQTWKWDGPGGGNFGPIARGAWTEFVIHHRRSTGLDGVTEVWMNGRQVVTYRGKTTFADFPRAAWKFGIYASESDVERAYVLYFGDVQVSSEPLTPGPGTPPSRTHP
jgi:Polysaccharide lyase